MIHSYKKSIFQTSCLIAIDHVETVGQANQPRMTAGLYKSLTSLLGHTDKASASYWLEIIGKV